MSGQSTPPGGTPPAVASDQSMEDILASIRRILNEDEAAAAGAPAAPGDPAAPAPAPAAAAPDAEPEPLLLTEDMMVPAAQDAPPPPPPVASEPPPAPVPSPDSLLAPAVAAAATASVGQLLRAVSSERGAGVYRGGPSIEDVVREELRPLLKDWLDQHLPGIVERLVRAEIERVTGRALS
jgi:cell pole-organizing protein PopZ